MKYIFPHFLIILIILFQIKSQENQQTIIKEIEENISKIDTTYQNLTEKMTEVKYNIILKYRYKRLESKREKIGKKLNQIKSGTLINEKILKELKEYVHSYKRSCHKVSELYDFFEDLKNTIINIVKIFFITVIIVIILVIIISTLIYLYIYRKRKNYEILQEEISHSDFQNINNDSELEKIKEKNKKIKKKKKKEKKKEYDEDDGQNKIKENKKDENVENVEVLDDK